MPFINILQIITRVSQFSWSKSGAFCCLIMCISFSSNCYSQEQPTSTTYYPNETNSVSQAYKVAAEMSGVASEIRYVEKTNQDFFSEEIVEAEKKDWVDSLSEKKFSRDGDYGVFLLVVGLLLALLFFVKFGSPGGLLDAPVEARESRKNKAKAWGVVEETGTQEDVFSQLDILRTQRESLILLLRHCLLQAGEETDTGFARADTERQVFKRLPQSWRAMDKLENILLKTELVHYGGRLLNDDDYQNCLKDGKSMLLKSGGTNE